MQCTALVIDDEPLARKRMISLLEPYSSEIEILGEAGSGTQAVKMIHEMLPDVVFLDIQIPDMDAFEVLHSLQGDDVPLVIFTTAFDNFALKAFEENTVDYLLKPVDSERLAVAIEKLRRLIPRWMTRRFRPDSAGKSFAIWST
jgi:two-component system LytT family response regulator